MGRIGKPEFAQALERAAQEVDDPGVRETATRALAALRMPQAASDPQPAAVETPAPPEPTVGAAPEKPVPQNETDDCVPRFDGK